MSRSKNTKNDVTTLVFHGADGSAEIVVDRAVVLRVAGGGLFAGGPMMAHLAGGAWHVGDQRLDGISVKGPVRVEFQHAHGARTFGPFAELSFVGDTAAAGGKVFARYRPAEEGWSFLGDAGTGDAPSIPPAAVLTPT
jgi:hypothetical protein